MLNVGNISHCSIAMFQHTLPARWCICAPLHKTVQDSVGLSGPMWYKSMCSGNDTVQLSRTKHISAVWQCVRKWRDGRTAVVTTAALDRGNGHTNGGTDYGKPTAHLGGSRLSPAHSSDTGWWMLATSRIDKCMNLFEECWWTAMTRQCNKSATFNVGMTSRNHSDLLLHRAVQHLRHVDTAGRLQGGCRNCNLQCVVYCSAV
jgi:hypothetical protein